MATPNVAADHNQWPAEGLENVRACPVCGETARAVLYSGLTDRDYCYAPGTWTYYRCEGCSSAYLDPRPTPDAIDLAYGNYYEGGSAPPHAYDGTQSAVRRLRRVLRHGYLNAQYGYKLRPASFLGRVIAPLSPRHREEADRSALYLKLPHEGARLLDVGCGEGAFLARMQAAGWSAIGLEPHADAVRLARSAVAQVRQGTLEQGTFEDESFDAVTLNVVVELLHDPAGMFDIARAILRPGGILALTAFNLDSYGHRLFRESWMCIGPPRVLVLFTASSLRAALERAGFEVLPPLPSRITPWVFQLSLAISRGLSPFENARPLPVGLGIRARIAELRAKRQPALAEQLIFLARKPNGRQAESWWAGEPRKAD